MSELPRNVMRRMQRPGFWMSKAELWGTRNTYGYINFDFGPTLLNWLDRNHPVVLEQLRKADRDSIARFGKGSAIAQPYHHPILPLCDDQD